MKKNKKNPVVILKVRYMRFEDEKRRDLVERNPSYGDQIVGGGMGKNAFGIQGWCGTPVGMHRLQRIPIPELADQLSEKSFKGDRIQSMGDGHPVQRLRERTHFKYGQGTVAFEQSPFSFLQEQRHVLQEHLLVRLIACNMLWTAHACPLLGEGADKVEVPTF